MGQTPAARPCQLRQKAAALGPCAKLHTHWVTVPPSLSSGCLSPSMAAPQAGGSQPLGHPQSDTPGQGKGQAAVVCQGNCTSGKSLPEISNTAALLLLCKYTSGNDSQSSLIPRAPQHCAPTAACNGSAPQLDITGPKTHQRDVLLCATTDSLFTHHHKHNLYSTHILSLERKYMHILIEIKIQTYCKKLNRAPARCAMGTLLSGRTEEESKKYSVRGLLPLCTLTVHCQKYSHLFITQYIEQFSELQWKTNQIKKPNKIQ